MLTANLATKLEGLLGANRVTAGEDALAPFKVDGVSPSAAVHPQSAAEVAEVIAFAATGKLAIVSCGSRSKLELGMPPGRYDIALDMTGLCQIAHYDAGDLTLSVDAGMSLRQLEQALAEKKQFLPFAVPCFETSTVGGTVTSGIDSALRQQYGTARDFLIGAEFVDGTGQLCKSGGRVVKNVTGYDLHKLLIGSLGTLGVITRVNFRTFPLPATFGGHLAGFGDSQGALKYRKTLETAGLPLANLEVFSPSVAEMIRAILQKSEGGVPPELEREEWCVYSSFEGDEAVVRRIAGDLVRIARETGAVQSRILETAEDESLGGMLRESFEWLRWASPANVIYRLALLEVKMEILAELLQLAESVGLRAALLVRAAGVVYFAVFAEGEDEAAIAPLTNSIRGVSSLALKDKAPVTLLHAPFRIKQNGGGNCTTDTDRDLQQRVKQAFDPTGVFAPG